MNHEITTIPIQIAERVNLLIDRAIPRSPRGIILFLHGSGSDRRSPRNRAVSAILRRAGYGTVLMDLLTHTEGKDPALARSAFNNVDILAQRVAIVGHYINREKRTAGLPLGLFAASLGARIGLSAIPLLPKAPDAMVTRGGRVDVPRQVLERVDVPTLLVVGEQDLRFVQLNRQALKYFSASEKLLKLVAGAGHLFERPGQITEVARLALSWFNLHCSTRTVPHCLTLLTRKRMISRSGLDHLI